MWGVGLESRGVCSPCSWAAGHQVALLSAKYRCRWPGPRAREPDHSPEPGGAEGGLCARGSQNSTMFKWWKKVVQSCVFPESPYFFLFFHRLGFYGARKLLSQPGVRKPQAASEGLSVLLNQGYLVGLKKPFCWNLVCAAGSALGL